MTREKMKRIKYLTPTEVEKRAKHKIAEIGSVFNPVKKVYGTITTNAYGKRYNKGTSIFCPWMVRS